MQILVIDSDFLLCRAVARMLADEGHEVITAPTSARGMILFRQKQPQIVIVDLLTEGIETILALRRDDADVKIIAASAYDTEMLETARLIGADETIAKPFRAHDLVDRVRSVAVNA
jgi:DNA-binding response OmpR family regulator